MTQVIHQTSEMQKLAQAAAAASRELARVDDATRTRIIDAMARGVEQSTDDLIAANEEDIVAATSAGLSSPMIDRLRLTDDRIASMVTGLRQVSALPDPLGKRLRTIERPNGLVIRRVSAPLGVILMIYESRPNVTADAAALCFKAGSAVILRGGSEAQHSNRAILEAMLKAGRAEGLPEHAIQLVETTDRAAVHELLQLDRYIDLVIPRGGESLIRAVAEHARIPVLKHYKGVCHVYVDRAANLSMARDIVVNAKCQRPGVCNAMETVLVHRDIAEEFLTAVGAALEEHRVELRCDDGAHALLSGSKRATGADWSTEYLDLILNVAVVDDLDGAIEHIATYGSHHSDAIVTDDDAAAETFTREVDSAAVYVNASTRFTDGFEFGMGAEIGISTDKLHARGPCGIEELTTYKYIVHGRGQTRE